MSLPLEIFEEIASNLNAADLRNFRISNRELAAAGTAIIARNGISALDTAFSLTRLTHALEGSKTLSRCTKQLTIYHGQWPVCSRAEWETHPLLFGGKARRSVGAPEQRAFADYSRFVREEQERTFHDDVQTFSSLLALLPTLQTMVISHMKLLAWHPSRSVKYQNLLEKIWIAPFIDDCVTLAVDVFLLALSSKSTSVTSLIIEGILDPAELHIVPGIKYSTIYKLSIASLRIHKNIGMLEEFLLAFPNLADLCITFKGWESSIPNVIGQLSWSSLRTLRLDDLWASEDAIFDLVWRHRRTLEKLSLGNTTIIQGSWKSLFTRIRGLQSQAHVGVDGELYGRRSRDTVRMDPEAAERFTSFMQNPTAPWPFEES